MIHRRSSIASFIGILVAGLSLIGEGRADDAAAADAPFRIETPWTVRIEPMAWYPALRGEISFAGGGDSESNRFDIERIDMDENNVTPGVRAEVRAEPWSFRFEGFLLDFDGDANADGNVEAGALAIANGTNVAHDLQIAAVEASVGHRIWELAFEDGAEPASDLGVIFDVYAGLRFIDLDLSLETPGGTADGGGEWVHPLVGVAATMVLPHGFGLDLRSDFGGFASGDDESFAWNIEVGMHWAFAENAAVEIGFRHLSLDLSEGDGDDEFIFDNALAGLFGAVVIRF